MPNTAGRVDQLPATSASSTFRELLSKADVRAAMASDSVPLPLPEDREGYHADRHLDYWLSGFKDAQHLLEQVHLPARGVRHLDLGGCTGRVARHVATLRPEWEVTLADINPAYVQWVGKHAAGKYKAIQTNPEPPLPFGARSLDLVSAYSVFSHIDHNDEAWLAELARVLKPGGFAYLTILDEASWEYTRTHDWFAQSMSRSGKEQEFLRKLAAGGIPEEKYVVVNSDNEAYNCCVFLRRSYVERVWSKHFKNLRFDVGGHEYQTIVVASN